MTLPGPGLTPALMFLRSFPLGRTGTDLGGTWDGLQNHQTLINIGLGRWYDVLDPRRGVKSVTMLKILPLGSQLSTINFFGPTLNSNDSQLPTTGDLW
jgi:hypothetical protein